jgi:hypothetical protein
MAKLITRGAWGAAPPSQPLQRITRTKGVKVHYTGGHVDVRIVDDHHECMAAVLGIQRMHMSGGRGEKYSDIGYNLIACPHGRFFMGRGPHVIPAANGPGLNSQHYAVLALLGSSGFTVPNDDLLHAVLDAIDYLRRHGNAGPEVKCHRDGYATSCPGDRLAAWVRRGAPRPKGSAKPSAPELPELRPGDTSPHVVTLRKKLGAANQTSKVYDPTDPDLAALVEAFKTRHKLGASPGWTAACWDALN